VYDKNDLVFKDRLSIIQMSMACFVAAILCGMTGIAGGMVLGPLFLKYNMLPTVMSATNQYITMIASICVAVQFSMNNQMIWPWALTFGVVALVSAYIGIQGVKKVIERSGKQSIIAVILTVVLVIALLSLPLKAVLMAQQAKTPATV
jgi:uncharacterized membrane protein YfcA